MKDIKFGGEGYKYKDICALFGDNKASGGKDREAQLRKWQKKYEIDKVGTRYIIKRELNEKDFDRIKKEKIKDFENLYPNFKIPYDERYSSGVYIIKKDNNIYVGQTSNFIRRYQHHIHKAMCGNGTKGSEILLEGNNMEIVRLMPESSRSERELVERTLIEYYSTNGDFNCLNVNKRRST